VGALRAALPAALFAALSNKPDGSPVFAYLSLSNFGRANAQGIEISPTYVVSNKWRLQASYSYFTYNVDGQIQENPLLPNTAKHQAKAGILYAGKRWDASARYRWVNRFPWSSGIYTGPVPTYSVVDASVNVSPRYDWTVGVDAANLLNNTHYEMFGGNLLSRRILGFVQYSWRKPQ
jgi:outer membrane receptor protein involved in Fe transport